MYIETNKNSPNKDEGRTWSEIKVIYIN